VTLIAPLSQVLAGTLAVVTVAVIAGRVKLLTFGGVAAAMLVGLSSVIAGPDWAVLLLFFFVTSTALSMWHADEKRAALTDIVEKGGRRDAVQVIANGGVFAAAAAASLIVPGDWWPAIGAGALAAAACDTWSTEVGTAFGGTPRHLLSLAPLPRGMSGGITAAGSAAGIAGAGAVALVVWLVHWDVAVPAVVGGGIVGGLTDSLLGATAQERRWCVTCSRATERPVHTCGSRTEVRGGVSGFGNDLVNLTSVIAGAVTTGVWP
jgi:uncharacterized protein (TIGR00297 family)